MTDSDVAPTELLNFVRCGCKSLNNMCNSMLCSCRRYGVICVSACGKYRGEICDNVEVSVTFRGNNRAWNVRTKEKLISTVHR